MSETKKNEAMELSLEEMEQISGGSGKLEALITRITRDGNSKMLKQELKEGGKPAAAAHCCELYPEFCGYCGAAVTMLK